MALVPFPSATPGDDDLEAESLDETGAKMSFLEHLDELRKRLIYIVYSLIAGCVVAYVFIGKIFDFIMRPMQQVLGPSAHLQYTSGAEPFMLYVKIGFLVGIFLASPLILWQVWKFIAPGLYTHEKKFAIPFVVMSTIFFTTGGLFAHYIAFPWTWTFFGSFANDYMIFVPKVDEAFSMYSKMILGFGLIFEMPTLVFVLARMGVISARFLMKYFKYAFLAIFIVAAVISPGTDMMSQVMMAAPMIVLYILSIGIAFVFQRRRLPDAD
ncbi:MAG TPA: twin-arginine translocase subunit TatC [Vicinamibacterales bacterium]|nr:twin-arginine translocase subunit TatC [Vicinamibacterales bacterium]